MLSAIERETVIQMSSIDNEWNVYTSQKNIMRKIEKLGIEPYKVDKIDGEIVAKFYKVPKKQIKIVKQRAKREYTEEERRILIERMNRIRELRKKGVEDEDIEELDEIEDEFEDEF